MDTFLVIVFWLSQAVTALLGIRVSLRSPTRDKHKWYITAFIFLATVGGTVNIIQTRRADDAQESLKKQLDTIQRNTEQPAVVKLPPPQKKHGRIDFSPPYEVDGAPLRPFHDGESTSINLKFRNGGDAPIRNSLLDGTLVVVPQRDVTATLPNVFSMYRNLLKPHVSSGTINPTENPALWHTFIGPTLDSTEASKINDGTDALCSIGLMIWEDDTGRYATDSAECFFRESGGSFQWHVLPEDNRETALK